MWKLQTVSKPLAEQSKLIRPSPLPVCRDLPLCNSLRHLCSFPGSRQLTTLLVAKLKTDPELPHVAAREDVWDPLNDEGAGFLLISSTRPCSSQWPFTHSWSVTLLFLLTLSLTNSEEGAQLHGAYGLRSIRSGAFWEVRLRRRIRAVEPRVRAVYVFHKTLGELQRKLQWRLKMVFKHITSLLLNLKAFLKLQIMFQWVS